MDEIGAWRKGSTTPLHREWTQKEELFHSSSATKGGGGGRPKHDYSAPFPFEKKQSMSSKLYSLELERDQAEAQLAQW